MTAVVALETAHGVWIGCDSLISSEGSKDYLKDPKWFRLGPFTIGWAGDLRTPQVALSLPVPRLRKPRENPLGYTLSELVEPLRTHLARRECPLTDDWLVITGKSLFTLHNGYALTRSGLGYAAIGSGGPYVLGALEVSGENQDPEDRIRQSLRAAAKHCPSVEPPFHISLVR